MSRPEDEQNTVSEQEKAERTLPELPSLPDLPEAPKLSPVLPPRPSKASEQNKTQSQNYGKSAIASMAATSFIMPIIVLALAGYWLDLRLKHSTDWFAGLGVLIGLAVGISSLMRLLQRLSDD